MNRLEIIAEIQRYELMLQRYDSVPEDMFNFGTIIRIAANNNVTKWHLIKDGEESWRYLDGNGSKTLAEWILEAIDVGLGYFEVYVLSPGNTPIYINE